LAGHWFEWSLGKEFVLHQLLAVVGSLVASVDQLPHVAVNTKQRKVNYIVHH